jgi:hypothetical protein
VNLLLLASAAFLLRQLKSRWCRAKNGLKLWGEFIKAISASLSIQQRRQRIKIACLNYLDALFPARLMGDRRIINIV